MSKEHLEALNTLASQYDGLPRQAYITHLSEKFTMTEIMAAAIVESWLSQGESNGKDFARI